MTGVRPWREIRRRRELSDEDAAWLEKADYDLFRWCTLRDFVDTLWAWIVNEP